MSNKTETELNTATDALPQYTGNIEAHIIADMLRIESITTELREFKVDTKERLNKMESWLVGIVAIAATTLVATIGILLESIVG